MEKGSLRGSTLTLLMTAFGTGIFTLHHVLERIGIILGGVLIALMGLSFIYSSFLLIHAYQ